MIELESASMVYQSLYCHEMEYEEKNRKKKKIDNIPAKKMVHYTNTDVLDALLKGCTFRASNLFYLNDSMEYYEGIRRLTSKIIKKHPMFINECNDLLLENRRGELNEGVYTISFSQEEDLLSQWITYAKESGVAIELDYNLINENEWYGFEKSAQEGTKDDCNDWNSLLCFKLAYNILNIDYREDSYYSGFRLLDDLDTNVNFIEKSMYIASFLKKKDFSAEKEVRLSVLPMFIDIKGTKKKAKINYYRMGERGILRPYIDITFGYCKREEAADYFCACLPVKTITVGPAGNQQTVFDSIVHRIRYGNPQIYDYKNDDVYMKRNIIRYIAEVLRWLSRKNYIESNFCYSEEAIYKMSSINDLISYIEDDEDKEFALSIVGAIVEEIERKLQKSVDYFDKSQYAMLPPSDEFILQEIKNDFFFSKEGLLIKKSKIPFIF